MKSRSRNRKKTIQTATVNAQIAKAEREAELRKQEVAVQQQQLDAGSQQESRCGALQGRTGSRCHACKTPA
ncbi:MAG: hypothetical protein ACLUAR_14465 [Pilosibacter sp.]